MMRKKSLEYAYFITRRVEYHRLVRGIFILNGFLHPEKESLSNVFYH